MVHITKRIINHLMKGKPISSLRKIKPVKALDDLKDLKAVICHNTSRDTLTVFAEIFGEPYVLDGIYALPHATEYSLWFSANQSKLIFKRTKVHGDFEIPATIYPDRAEIYAVRS